MPQSRYTTNVFINCPFDSDFTPIFNAIIFTVFDCGYLPRCAMELDDSSEVRIDKITKIISECKYGIHDISRTELNKDTALPRFNMPLELAPRHFRKNDNPRGFGNPETLSLAHVGVA